jgi:hypothetical protein
MASQVESLLEETLSGKADEASVTAVSCTAAS